MYVRAIYIPLREEISCALLLTTLFSSSAARPPLRPASRVLAVFPVAFPEAPLEPPRRRYPRVCDHRADVLPNCLCFYHARTFPRPPPADPGPSVAALAPRLNERPRVPGCAASCSRARFVGLTREGRTLEREAFLTRFLCGIKRTLRGRVLWDIGRQPSALESDLILYSGIMEYYDAEL